jgi:hypothetical protein
MIRHGSLILASKTRSQPISQSQALQGWQLWSSPRHYKGLILQAGLLACIFAFGNFPTQQSDQAQAKPHKPVPAPHLPATQTHDPKASPDTPAFPPWILLLSDLTGPSLSLSSPARSLLGSPLLQDTLLICSSLQLPLCSPQAEGTKDIAVPQMHWQ